MKTLCPHHQGQSKSLPNEWRTCEKCLRRLARQRKRTAAYRKTDKFKATFAKWKESGGREYKAKWIAAKRSKQPKSLRPLTDGYVREVLTSRSILHRSEIPAEVMQVQREHLRLKRELRRPRK